MECRTWSLQKICSPCLCFGEVEQDCIFVHQNEYFVITLHVKFSDFPWAACYVWFILSSLAFICILPLTFENMLVFIGHLLCCLGFPFFSTTTTTFSFELYVFKEDLPSLSCFWVAFQLFCLQMFICLMRNLAHLCQCWGQGHLPENICHFCCYRQKKCVKFTPVITEICL